MGLNNKFTDEIKEVDVIIVGGTTISHNTKSLFFLKPRIIP